MKVKKSFFFTLIKSIPQLLHQENNLNISIEFFIVIFQWISMFIKLNRSANILILLKFLLLLNIVENSKIFLYNIVEN